VALLIALVVRSQYNGTPPIWIKALGAVLLGPPLAWSGYTFLRDPELEAYRGLPLILRATICGLVYAALWAAFWFLGYRFFALATPLLKPGLEIWQMIVLVVPIFAAGTLAAYASFDLDPGSAFFHCALYFAVTVMLRLVAHMPAIPGLGGS